MAGISERAGESVVLKKEEELEAARTFYRPFAAAKAVRWIVHSSTDLDQTRTAGVIKDRIGFIKGIIEKTDEGQFYTDEGSSIINAIDKIVDKDLSTAEQKKQDRDKVYIRMDELAVQFDSLFKRGRITGENYSELVNILRDLSPSPADLTDKYVKTQSILSKSLAADTTRLPIPTGSAQVIKEAKLVDDFLANLTSDSAKIIALYSGIGKDSSAFKELVKDLDFQKLFHPDEVYLLKELAKERIGASSVDEIMKQGRKMMSSLDFGKQRTNYRQRPPVGTVRTETEQIQMGPRFAAAIHMYHTLKRVPTTIIDLERRYNETNRLTPFQKKKVLEVLAKTKREYIKQVQEGLEGKSGIYEDYASKSDPEVVPMDLVEDALKVATGLKDEDTERTLKGGLEEWKYEVFYILQDQTSKLTSQVHKQWPIRTIDKLDDKITWYLIGDGVGQFFKKQGRLTKKERTEIENSSRKDFNITTKNEMEKMGQKLESEFQEWLKTNKEKIDENKERRLRVDGPFAKFVMDLEQRYDIMVRARIDSAQFVKMSKAQEAKLKDVDLERNAVELTRPRARARAIEAQSTGYMKWRTVKPARDMRTAIPFIVNAYMRDNRLEQIKIIEKELKVLTNPKTTEEKEYVNRLSGLLNLDRHIKDLEKTKSLFGKIASYDEMKKALDGIWHKYEDLLYVPKASIKDLKILKSVLPKEQKEEIDKLIDWINVKPTDVIKPDDLHLPQMDKPTTSFKYPLSRTELYDNLKKFRESEDKKISKKAIEISGKLVNAPSESQIGMSRDAISKELGRLSDSYERKKERALPLRGDNPLAKILRMRYEDNYISPNYASDAFGILSLMESGMLHVSKKPSDFVNEYLAMGRMLEPASAFPKIAKDEVIQTYNVMPSMRSIQYQSDNIHAQETIKSWAKIKGLDGILELASEGLLDPYIEAAAMQMVDVKDVVSDFERFESEMLVALGRNNEMGDVIYRKITKGKDVGKYTPRDTFAISEEKQKDGSIRITNPALIALTIPPKNRTKDQDNLIKQIDNLLSSSGYKQSQIIQARTDLAYVLTYMIGNEDRFINRYSSYKSYEEERLKGATIRGVRRAAGKSIRNAVPEAGPYLNELLDVVSKYIEDVDEYDIMAQAQKTRSLLLLKEEKTEEEYADIESIFELITEIKMLGSERAVGPLVYQRWLKDVSYEEARLKTETYIATSRVKSTLWDMIEEDRRRVEIERKALAKSLNREREKERERAKKDKKPLPPFYTPEQLRTIVFDKVKRQIKAEDVFEKDKTFREFEYDTNYIISTLTAVDYVNSFRKDADSFYNKSIIEILASNMSELDKNLTKTQAKEKAEEVLLTQFSIGPAQARKSPAEFFIDTATNIPFLMESMDSNIAILSKLTGRTPESMRAAVGIRSSKVKELVDWIPDTKRILEERKQGKIMSFFGTPHMRAHQPFNSTKKAAESFFGIDLILAQNGYEAS